MNAVHPYAHTKKIITTRNKKSRYVSLCAGSSSEFDDFGGNL